MIYRKWNHCCSTNTNSTITYSNWLIQFDALHLWNVSEKFKKFPSSFIFLVFGFWTPINQLIVFVQRIKIRLREITYLGQNHNLWFSFYHPMGNWQWLMDHNQWVMVNDSMTMTVIGWIFFDPFDLTIFSGSGLTEIDFCMSVDGLIEESIWEFSKGNGFVSSNSQRAAQLT